MMSNPLKGHNGTIRVVRFQPVRNNDGSNSNNLPFLLASAGILSCSLRMFFLFSSSKKCVFHLYIFLCTSIR